MHDTFGAFELQTLKLTNPCGPECSTSLDKQQAEQKIKHNKGTVSL